MMRLYDNILQLNMKSWLYKYINSGSECSLFIQDWFLYLSIKFLFVFIHYILIA